MPEDRSEFIDRTELEAMIRQRDLQEAWARAQELRP